jgi:hypothetical protein
MAYFAFSDRSPLRPAEVDRLRLDIRRLRLDADLAYLDGKTAKAKKLNSRADEIAAWLRSEGHTD